MKRDDSERVRGQRPDETEREPQEETRRRNDREVMERVLDEVDADGC